MIKGVTLKNLTTLPNEEFKFAGGLNVIVAENGFGKTHLLKVLYTLLKVNATKGDELTKSSLEKKYADKLVGVFRPESLGRLVKRKQGRARCEIKIQMKDDEQSCSISFATQASTSVQVDCLPTSHIQKSPVYFPTRELLTLSPWFVNLYDNYVLEFEETWRDTTSLLGAPALKGKRAETVAELLRPLEEAMGGQVFSDPKSGRFYLQVAGDGTMEMPLVAEGLRKVAMLARLISTGVLLQQGYLFWDEPETNLNPKLLRVIAMCIMNLSAQGIQVFIATHSLFLLRELEMLTKSSEFKKVKQRYFALASSENGIALQQGDSIDDLNSLVLLEEELRQTDRFLALEDDNAGD
jgi:predicted ATPase